VRELENMMRRIAALQREAVVTAAIIDTQSGQTESSSEPPLPGATDSMAAAIDRHIEMIFAGFGRALPPDGLYDRMLAELERPLLIRTLAAVRHNQLRAARLLGINRNTLRKKLADLGIEAQKPRR
jgi:two-component system nitrogen regulation response regulator GlnG